MFIVLFSIYNDLDYSIIGLGDNEQFEQTFLYFFLLVVLLYIHNSFFSTYYVILTIYLTILIMIYLLVQCCITVCDRTFILKSWSILFTRPVQGIQGICSVRLAK